jgi:hypothetical protein
MINFSKLGDHAFQMLNQLNDKKLISKKTLLEQIGVDYEKEQNQINKEQNPTYLQDEYITSGYIETVTDVSKNEYEEFSNLIDKLLDLNIRNRGRISNQIRKDYDIIRYAKEHCTVKISVGRMSGKTTWSMNKIKDVLTNNRDLNILYVSSSMCLIDTHTRNLNLLFNGKVNFVSRNCLNRIKEKEKPSLIIVDDAFLTKDNIDDLYEFSCSKIKEQIFIFLGN